MELIILGSGTTIPLGYRASPSLLLQTGGQRILFDIGPGALRQLTRVGVAPESIGAIFVTHFHPDHTADLVHFLFATRNPGILERRRPFTVTGPKGLKDFITGLQTAYGDWLRLPAEILKIEELGTGMPKRRDEKGFKVKYCSTTHTAESLAYRVEDGRGKSMVYSGDTGFCDEIVELAGSASLLILEASFPEGREVKGHLTPFEAGRIAALAGADRLVLTHFYPECLAADITAQCRKSYGGELTLASDLLHVHV
jgi:ribonuclease BN (tRNA processing enzyme)